jgi:pimeloyl-ACP methyl ester carboxylesterase
MLCVGWSWTTRGRSLFLSPSFHCPEVSCAALGGVKVPAIVVGGEQTRLYYSLINEVVVRCIPGAHLVIIPEATHLMNYQNPPAFNKALLQFLARLRGGMAAKGGRTTHP